MEEQQRMEFALELIENAEIMQDFGTHYWIKVDAQTFDEINDITTEYEE